MEENKNISVKDFLEALYSDHLKQHAEHIEIRRIGNGTVRKVFYGSINDLLTALDALNKQNDRDNTAVYFGVAPRSERKGTKDAIKYITCFWVDIDTGTEGHKKQTGYKDKKEALELLAGHSLHPSAIVDSGNGLHCYWLLKESLQVTSIPEVESVLNGLIAEFKGDTGTGDITRILRVPDTKNWKDRNNPKLTKVIKLEPSLKYSLADFEAYKLEEEEKITASKTAKGPSLTITGTLPEVNLTNKNILSRVIILVREGDRPGYYTSRSERDQAIITELLLKGLTDLEIKAVFSNSSYGCSDKYLERGRSGDSYLLTSIKNGREYIKAKELEPIEQKISDQFVKLPAELYKTIEKFLKGKIMPWEQEGVKRIEENGNIIYERVTKEGGRKEIIRYVIPNKDLPEAINLGFMKEAYVISLALAGNQRNNIIQFTLADKLKLLGKENANSKERKEREQAEYLLQATRYESLTLRGKQQREVYQNLYASIDIVTDLDQERNKRYEVELTKSYLKNIDIETGKITGRFFTQRLPLHAKGSNEEKLYLKLLDYFSNLSGRLLLNIKNLLNDKLEVKLELSARTLGRRKECIALWENTIEPGLREAGINFRINKQDQKDLKDIREWQLTLQCPDKKAEALAEELDSLAITDEEYLLEKARRK